MPAADGMDRRTFMRRSVLACGALAVGGPLGCLLRSRANAAPASGAYGPLAPVTDRTTGLPLLLLPAGFSYASFGWAGDPMAGGAPTPAWHDGMAVVRAKSNRLWLVRNHEARSGSTFGPPDITYDASSGGGTTTLTFDLDRGEWEEARPSLAGTSTNCAGGPTPWHTWLTCEETVADLGAPHGFVFEVPAPGAGSPVPLTAMGRFVHEAVAVDPETGIVYETEDRGTAGFYRFIPAVKGNHLARGGRLEMLRVFGRDGDLRGGFPPRTVFDVGWVDIGDPTRAHSPGTTDTLGVFTQGRERGGAVFSRLEGCWAGNERIYFISTGGGAAGEGQVWEYWPGRERLRLLYESPGQDTLDNPDNLAVSPRGGLLLCEDGDRSPQRLHGLPPEGRIVPFAESNLVLSGQRNGITGDFRGFEWAGATFYRNWLFVNLQTPGVTFAITGPWKTGAL